MMNTVLMVDPSSLACGWCVAKVVRGKRVEYVASGCLKPPKTLPDEDDPGVGTDLEWLARADWVAGELTKIAKEHKVVEAWIEWPGVQQSAAGQAAANSGAGLKLMGVAMGIRADLTWIGVSVYVVTVRSWKGQVPKNITQERIQRHWGLCPKDHNEADAVGMLDWYTRKHRRLNTGLATQNR